MFTLDGGCISTKKRDKVRENFIQKKLSLPKLKLKWEGMRFCQAQNES